LRRSASWLPQVISLPSLPSGNYTSLVSLIMLKWFLLLYLLANI